MFRSILHQKLMTYITSYLSPFPPYPFNSILSILRINAIHYNSSDTDPLTPPDDPWPTLGCRSHSSMFCMASWISWIRLRQSRLSSNRKVVSFISMFTNFTNCLPLLCNNQTLSSVLAMIHLGFLRCTKYYTFFPP